MKHSKRARTQELFGLVVNSRNRMSNTWAAGFQSNWSHKTAAEVLADMNVMLANAGHPGLINPLPTSFPVSDSGLDHKTKFKTWEMNVKLRAKEQP